MIPLPNGNNGKPSIGSWAALVGVLLTLLTPVIAWQFMIARENSELKARITALEVQTQFINERGTSALSLALERINIKLGEIRDRQRQNECP